MSNFMTVKEVAFMVTSIKKNHYYARKAVLPVIFDIAIAAIACTAIAATCKLSGDKG